MAEKGRSGDGGAAMAEKGRSAARRVLRLQERLRRAWQPAEVPRPEAPRSSGWAAVSVFIRAFLCERGASAWF